MKFVQLSKTLKDPGIIFKFQNWDIQKNISGDKNIKDIHPLD